MPAIRPQRLQQQAAEIAAAIDDPRELARRLRDLLSYHADRTRRSAGATTADDAADSFGAPRPVLAAIERALSQALRSDPGRAPALAETLWGLGYREARLLTASVLADLPWESSHEQVEAFVRRSRDRTVQKVLAERGLSGWQSADRPAVLAVLGRWLRARDERVRRLALIAVGEQVSETSPASLRPYYQLLEGLPPRVYESAPSDLQNVLEVLARRNPAEAAQFLMDELRRSNRRPDVRRIAERSLSAFPEPQRSELADVLAR